MTETTHTRSRRASVGGLLLQLAAAGGLLALALATRSSAAYQLAWYLLGGVPLWFVALLVFRQRELAALEALDLEELRREKQAVGGEALFGAEGTGGLGFRVAEVRLNWMQRWLVPGFGLLTAIYLGSMGVVLWRGLAVTRVVAGLELPGLTVGGEGWPALQKVPIALVVLAIVMLATFLFSRYTSGMGRVKDWQLLRGCGSYMLGNALVLMVLLVCLGVQQYAGAATWEQALAFVIPILMAVLAAETLINFVLDIYRPRTPGVEPRACFDSRLLGLLAEPGGIASSIADAINYQFGFQVSQTWFYQLLQRAFLPLLATGALALWLLTCIVIVQPYEHVIIERWGRQLNAQDPLKPGIHAKLPWPIDAARAYNTGQLHEIHVGFKSFAAVPDYSQATAVQLWTDERHMGQEHFDFLICPTERKLVEEPASQPAPDGSAPGATKETPVNLIRMDVTVQYRIQPDRLAVYSSVMTRPEDALLALAWEEVGRFTTSSTVDQLLGQQRTDIGVELREHIARRSQSLGLDVVYVGVTNVHPEKSVAEAFRNVVKAEQEKVAAIREALVTESERLSKVAGDAPTARYLARAVERSRKASELVNDSEQALRSADPALVAALTTRLKEVEPQFQAHIEAEAELTRAREAQREVEQDFELGLGRTLEERRQSVEASARSERAEQAAAAALTQAVALVRAEAEQRLSVAQADALLHGDEARLARNYWDGVLARGFTVTRLEGEAAALLASALAERWTKEMNAAKDLIEMQNEREAYLAAPEVYKTRRLIDVLVNGVKDSRKFFLAFDPGKRNVHVRFVVDDQVRLEPVDISAERKR